MVEDIKAAINKHEAVLLQHAAVINAPYKQYPEYMDALNTCILSQDLLTEFITNLVDEKVREAVLVTRLAVL